VGSVPIVSGTVPLAVGAGLSAQMNGQKQIAVSYFGDGATEEGVFHESLNLASKFKLPVLFVCENNLFSSHLHITERQPFSSVLRFGDTNGIKNKRVDGNNIVAI
jgi:pyruvate dehydrogenase E1 component alpha subunit